MLIALCYTGMRAERLGMARINRGRVMYDELARGEPSLQEETRAAHGRTVELLLSVVVLSSLFGLALNLGSVLLAQYLTTEEQLIVVGGCLALAVLTVALLVPHISTAVREFHDEIEIALPLLTTEHEIEVLRVEGYDEITEIAHGALASRPAEERRRLAAALRNTSKQHIAESRRAVMGFVAEMTQFLFTVQVARGSRRVLSSAAAFHKYRAVARQQSAIVSADLRTLLGVEKQRRGAPVANKDGDGVSSAPTPRNRYLAQTTTGVPEKLLLPGRVRLRLLDIAPQLDTLADGKADARASTAKKGAKAAGIAGDQGEVVLLRADAGRDTALEITALADYSEYGQPSVGQPRKGLTTRCLLRNASDQRLRTLARDEEAAAMRIVDGDSSPEAVQRYRELCTQLYDSSQQLHIMRVFVRFDGAFRIRLLSGERRQRGLYAWGAALSRLMDRVDIEVFLAALKEAGQRTPRRWF